MKTLSRRRIAAAALSLTAAVGGLLVPGTAHAQTVTTGSLSFSGDSGDYISQGKSWSYSTANGDGLSVSSSGGSLVSVSINAYNGDWWTLDIDAPGTAVLAPGTYTAAHRYPFNGTGPGLDLSGNGRGCNTLFGSFTITKAVFGAQGYVQAFDATFVQHCEGVDTGPPVARGEVHISNPAQPAQPTPKRTTAAPRATPTSRPSGTAASGASTTPSGSPGATASDSGNTAANDTDPSTRAMPKVVRNAFRTPLLLLGVAFVVWVVVAVVGLVTVGIVLAVRRR